MNDEIISKMTETFTSVGFGGLYKHTIERCMFFYEGFRNYFKPEEITNDELAISVALNFSIYGQQFVYGMYVRTIQAVPPDKTLSDVFGDFCKIIKDNLPIEIFHPKPAIGLFMEYIFARVIKNE